MEEHENTVLAVSLKEWEKYIMDSMNVTDAAAKIIVWDSLGGYVTDVEKAIEVLEECLKYMREEF